MALAVMLVACSPGARVSGTNNQIAAETPSHCGPLRTAGPHILNAQGREAALSGVNWFGFETESFAPHGLEVRNYQDMLNQMAHLGFNTIRLPYSNQLFDSASKPTGINYNLNPDLRGKQGLALMDQIVAGATKSGLCVILDQHRPNAYAQSELWYTDHLPESRWLSDWVMLAKHYAGNPTVIGADLHNEPHGPATWGDGKVSTDWRLAAERGGNAILAVNPDWLIMVEGIESYQGDSYWWGGNLMGAKQFPVRLSRPDKLVYSAHDYGPEVWQQSWLKAPNFPKNLPDVWQNHWAYLQNQGIAPVYVGEFGGAMNDGPEGVWLSSLVNFLNQQHISYTYWSWNPDSGDTGGLLKNDWTTVDQARLNILRSYQWPMLAQPGV